MKRYVIFICLLCISFIGIVKADNGPSEHGSILLIKEPEKDYIYIYDEGTIDNNALEGITYDVATNTLTFSNFKGSYALVIDYMGEDFKIKAAGINDFIGIYVDGYSYKTTVTFTGNGKLILNKDKNEEYPIPIVSREKNKLIFEENISLEFYSTVEDDNPMHPTVVIGCDDMKADDPICITFKGNDSPEVKSFQKAVAGGAKEFWGFAIIPEEIEIFKTATKDSKKYAYTVDNDSKVTIYLNELKEDPYSHKWYIGNTDSDEENKTTYDNAETATTTAGYTLTEDKAYRGYYRYTYYLQEDEDGKQYGLILSSDYYDAAPYGLAFEMTDKKLTIGDKEYAYLEYSNIDIDDIEPVPEYEYVNEYVHYVEGEKLILDRTKKSDIVNPKTGDMDLLPIFLILIIGMSYSIFLLNKNNKFKRNI